MKKGRRLKSIFFLAIVFVLWSINFCSAQDNLDDMLVQFDARLKAIEDYLNEDLPIALNELGDKLTTSLNKQISAETNKIIALNPLSRQFNKIETNTGAFLIAIDRVEEIKDGYQMYLHVGNPYLANFTGLKLLVKWGRKWREDSANFDYDEWRSSLTAYEYDFTGVLEAGRWTEIPLKLTPAKKEEFQYLEIEMSLQSAELKKITSY